MKHLIKIILFGLLIVTPYTIFAQCDFTISTKNRVSSTCAANGSFEVELTPVGGSVVRTVNYEIKSQYSSFERTQANPIFTAIPSGIYNLTAEIICEDNTSVTKATTVTIGGTYTSPTFTASLVRNNLSCGNYGKINVNISGGKRPYSISISPKSDGTPGTETFNLNSSESNYTITNLAAANYSVSVRDDCGTEPGTQTVIVKQLPSLAAFISANPDFLSGHIITDGQNCGQYIFRQASIKSKYEDWKGYSGVGDTPLQWAVSFDGGPKSDYRLVYHSEEPIVVDIPSGKDYTNYYDGPRDFAKIYLKSPCEGDVIIDINNFARADDNVTKLRVHKKYKINCALTKCNAIFKPGGNDSFDVPSFCYPVTVYLSTVASDFTNSITFQMTGNNIESMSPELDLSTTYYIKFKDNNNNEFILNDHKSIRTPSVPGNHYSCTIMPNVDGVNKGVSFRFTHFNGSVFEDGTTITLISPSIYSSTTVVSGSSSTYTYASQNSNAAPGTYDYYFRPGTYEWKIEDSCGEHQLSITVLDSDVYTYTIDNMTTNRTCTGMQVILNGTTYYQNATSSSYFKVYKGPALTSSMGTLSGVPIELTIPGEYQFMVLAAASAGVASGFGDDNVITIPYTYEGGLRVDMEVSKGFVCIGDEDNEGQIYARAAGGVGSYTYTLYETREDANNGVNPIHSNSSGDFNLSLNLGLIKNRIYYLKVTDDACVGSAVIQEIPVVDLATMQKSWAEKYSLCFGETLKLYAIALPNPTYSWTGPNGFTSSLRTPEILNVTSAEAGAYNVEINSVGYCGLLPPLEPLNIKVSSCLSINDDYIKVFKNNSIDIDVLANDYIEGGTTGITFNVSSGPSKGSASLAGGNKIKYDNSTGLLGNDEFTYEVCKGGNCATAKVYVTILNVPTMILSENCTFNPKLVLDYQHQGATYNWEYDDGNGWQPVGNNKPELETTNPGRYRVTVSLSNSDGSIISFVSAIKELTITKQTSISTINKVLYELSLQ